MFNQHAKWLKVTPPDSVAPTHRVAELPADVPRLAAGSQRLFSHQDPGFIDHVVNKKADVIRVYLPPDANTLLSVADHCLRSRNYVNVIVAGKQPALQYLDMDAARQALHGRHRHLGVGEQRSRRRAGRGHGLRGRRADAGNPGRGRACCASMPPDLKVRVINVVDLMRLQPAERTSARPLRPRLRRALHDRQTHHLRLSWLSVAHPPAGLSPDQPPESPRPRVQGGRNHHDAVRHGRAERYRSFSPDGGRH